MSIIVKDGQGQGHPLLHAGGHLQGAGLSARGYPGVYGVTYDKSKKARQIFVLLEIIPIFAP